MTYESISVGNEFSTKPNMQITCLQNGEYQQWFKKRQQDNLIKISISLDMKGSKYHVYENNFDKYSFQDMIDQCNFDTTTTPIEICITEEKDDDYD